MMHIGLRRAIAAAFVAVLAACFLAGRTDAISIRLPLGELSAASSVVVRGRVERIEPAWNANREIESTVYVRLSGVSRGELSSGAVIPVRVRGGSMDGLTMWSEEEAEFETGEEVYLFLGGLLGDGYRVTAGRQGKFDVVGDRAINRATEQELRLADLETGVRENRWPAGAETGSAFLSHTRVTPAGTPSPADIAAGAGVEPMAYVYSGAKWFGPNPMEESYLINVNTGDAGGANGSVEAFRNAIIAAANSWGSAGAAFSMQHGGPTSVTTKGYDEKNVIFWENMGSTTTLAEATWWTFDKGRIVETDIRFNDYYVWDATGAPAKGEPDLQSIAVHELGHWLSLSHDTEPGCPSAGPVMCASYVMGTVKRALSANDIAGVKAIYGPGATQPTATPTSTPTRPNTPTPTRTYGPTLSPGQIKSRIYLPMIRMMRQATARSSTEGRG
jgi:hypothetical protein